MHKKAAQDLFLLLLVPHSLYQRPYRLNHEQFDLLVLRRLLLAPLVHQFVKPGELLIEEGSQLVLVRLD